MNENNNWKNEYVHSKHKQSKLILPPDWLMPFIPKNKWVSISTDGYLYYIDNVLITQKENQQ